MGSSSPGGSGSLLQVLWGGGDEAHGIRGPSLTFRRLKLWRAKAELGCASEVPSVHPGSVPFEAPESHPSFPGAQLWPRHEFWAASLPVRCVQSPRASPPSRQGDSRGVPGLLRSLGETMAGAGRRQEGGQNCRFLFSAETQREPVWAHGLFSSGRS